MRLVVPVLVLLALALPLTSCDPGPPERNVCTCKNEALTVNNTRSYTLCGGSGTAQSDAVDLCLKDFGAAAQCTCTCTKSETSC
jgi:hypothetical protein